MHLRNTLNRRSFLLSVMGTATLPLLGACTGLAPAAPQGPVGGAGALLLV